MKVLFDFQTFALQRRGGVSRYFLELVKGLRSFQDVQSDVFGGVHDSDVVEEVVQYANVRSLCLRVPSRGRGVSLRLLINKTLFSRHLARSGCDIYHPTFYWTPETFPRTKVVLTIYDLIHERFPSLFDRRDPTIGWRTRSLPRADLVLAISECTKRDLVEHYSVPESRIVVTPLANGLRGVLPIQCEVGKPFLLFVGKRDGYKNFDVIVRMFRTFPKLCDTFDLVCFGGGAGGSDGLPVRFVSGSDSVLAGLYRSAYALVYPSLYEGFGLPLLEAMYFGCPVIASRCGSLVEVGGDAALYFEPSSVEELHACVEKLAIDSVRKDFLARGMRRESEFSWGRTVESTYTAYKSLL